MIEVLFFASIREQLGTERISMPLPMTLMTVAAFKEAILSEHASHWAEVLNAKNVITAVNQQIVGPDHVLADGDEVAFFPPVTGG